VLSVGISWWFDPGLVSAYVAVDLFGVRGPRGTQGTCDDTNSNGEVDPPKPNGEGDRGVDPLWL